MRLSWYLLIVATVLVLGNVDAFSAEQETCKKFRIVFEDSISKKLDDVYVNDEVAGVISSSESSRIDAKEIQVCIDRKYAGKFEINSVCYVSGNRIVVYNAWSTGIDLKDGEAIKGFTSRMNLYIYEARELSVLIKDTIRAFVLEYANKFLGESTVSKAKDVYGVMAK
ncbi:hypothetical protein [Fundidesulfovibrio putealis]|uniref:hypothetical protein n=1 Tax=Fundidesulfovibrio putealis TaxID=270496 RepID=UPI0012EC56E9|nr:hypothetical protein [Fundidesulfovibrio putealis]